MLRPAFLILVAAGQGHQAISREERRGTGGHPRSEGVLRPGWVLSAQAVRDDALVRRLRDQAARDPCPLPC